MILGPREAVHICHTKYTKLYDPCELPKQQMLGSTGQLLILCFESCCVPDPDGALARTPRREKGQDLKKKNPGIISPGWSKPKTSRLTSQEIPRVPAAAARCKCLYVRVPWNCTSPQQIRRVVFCSGLISHLHNIAWSENSGQNPKSSGLLLYSPLKLQ